MKPFFLAAMCWGGLSLLIPVLSTAQTESRTPDPKALVVLLQEVQAQQKTLVEDQAKMDEKLVAIAESLRQARIYITRGR